MISEHLLSIDSEKEWRLALPITRSVFGSFEYARITQTYKGDIAKLFVVQSGRTVVTYPLFLRSLGRLPFVEDKQADWQDSYTPEYTGPSFKGIEVNLNAFDIKNRFHEMCINEQIVAEFAHLHPWTIQSKLLDLASITVDREIVYVDLTLDMNQLWKESFTRACRKNINRSKREDVRVFPASTPDHVHSFYKLYVHTMDRNAALERYYFPLEYFMSFYEMMPDNARFVLSEYQDQIVAGTLYLHDNENIYSFLGGADQAFQYVRPSNAVIYDTIQWGQEQGKLRLVLGGGYKPDDGIFRFKSSFSPNRAQFHVYKKIHLPNEYDQLCSAWSDHFGVGLDDIGFFPIYRAKPMTNSPM